MNWAIKIISKTLMTKISHILWVGYDNGVTTKVFTVVHYFLPNYDNIQCYYSKKVISKERGKS